MEFYIEDIANLGVQYFWIELLRQSTLRAANVVRRLQHLRLVVLILLDEVSRP